MIEALMPLNGTFDVKCKNTSLDPDSFEEWLKSQFHSVGKSNLA